MNGEPVSPGRLVIESQKMKISAVNELERESESEIGARKMEKQFKESDIVNEL